MSCLWRRSHQLRNIVLSEHVNYLFIDFIFFSHAIQQANRPRPISFFSKCARNEDRCQFCVSSLIKWGATELNVGYCSQAPFVIHPIGCVAYILIFSNIIFPVLFFSHYFIRYRQFEQHIATENNRCCSVGDVLRIVQKSRRGPPNPTVGQLRNPQNSKTFTALARACVFERLGQHDCWENICVTKRVWESACIFFSAWNTTKCANVIHDSAGHSWSELLVCTMILFVFTNVCLFRRPLCLSVACIFGLRFKWFPIHYIGHHFWTGPIGLWSEVVRCAGSRVPFGTHRSSLSTRYRHPAF